MKPYQEPMVFETAGHVECIERSQRATYDHPPDTYNYTDWLDCLPPQLNVQMAQPSTKGCVQKQQQQQQVKELSPTDRVFRRVVTVARHRERKKK